MKPGHEHRSHCQGDHRGHHEHMLEDFRRRFSVSLALTAPILVLSPMLQEWVGLEDTLRFPYDSYVQFSFATCVFLYGGWPFLKGCLTELRDRRPGMMTLIGIAISVAYLYSSFVVFGLSGKVFYWELATLIDIMLLGHWIEMRSVLGASGALEELVKLMPSDAHRVRDNGTEDVSVTELHSGDLVLVKPGEKIPVDGVITEGRTTIDQALLTGESQPVEREEGDEVIGGAVNGEAAITVEVRKTGEETYLSQVVEMVRKAQESRSRSQNLADRAAFWLTLIAIVAGITTLAVWLAVGVEFDFGLERMVTVMVITCPHALGLAVPLVVAVSTSLAARLGILIRDRNAFERSRLLDAVVFDKTGTLTEGRFGVAAVLSLGDMNQNQVLELAASLESQSEHPIAQGIVEKSRERDLTIDKPRDFKAIPGKGAAATVGGRNVKVVSPGYLKENGLSVDSEEIETFAEEGKTVVYVLVDDQVEGAIALADIVREESREAIDQLKAMGIKVLMITGDATAVAQSVADELGLDDFFAEVLPDKKAERIQGLKRKGMTVAMVGDGVNDAPALAEADVGVAIGAGTDVAMETADIVLVDSDPRDVVHTVKLANRTYSKMVQNLWWASGYNIVAIPLAAGAFAWAGIILSPAVGAAIMSVSTVIVAVNAKLLGRGSPGEAAP